MLRRSLLTVITFLVLVPTAAMARNSDPEFRFCEQTAANNRGQRMLAALRFYHTNWINIMESDRQRYFDSWGIENDRDRSNVQRAIDTDTRNQLTNINRGNSDDKRNILTAFRNEDRFCRDDFAQRVRNVPVGQGCLTSADCTPLGQCTTETGTCKPVCQPNSNPCIQVCSGTCRLRS